LKIFDILKNKNKLVPEKENNKMRIFLCGPTSSQDLHFGHARFFFVFDLISRILNFHNIQTTTVINITDLDPKIFSKAKDNRMEPNVYVEQNICEFLELSKQLNFKEGMIFAKVSEFIPQMIKIIQNLLSQKDAYQSFGNVYLRKGKILGNLSKKLEYDIADTRFDIAPGKKDSNDILLWNCADTLDYFYPGVDLGKGLPWWHIQDVSVITTLFGGEYDIHGGGTDLIIPHHENINSILSKINKNSSYPRFWMHVGLVYNKKKKMSKSSNNGIKIKELLRKYNPNTLKLYSYSEHYRSQMSFSELELRVYQKLDYKLQEYMLYFGKSIYKSKNQNTVFKKFMRFLDNDLNTVEAINILKNSLNEKSLQADIGKMVNILGLKY
jgi:cysteinyl-tRNA synthetase